MAECGGKVLSLMEQAPPFEIKIGRDGSIRTALIKVSLNDQLPKNKPLSGGTFSAHGKTAQRQAIVFMSAFPLLQILFLG